MSRPVQVLEARAYGADCVLLIVACLEKSTPLLRSMRIASARRGSAGAEASNCRLNCQVLGASECGVAGGGATPVPLSPREAGPLRPAGARKALQVHLLAHGIPN